MRIPTLILVLFLCSCLNSADYKTVGFNKMLVNFNSQIPEEYHIYFVIPKFSCHGCLQRTLIEINKYSLPRDRTNITFICGVDTLSLDDFREKSEIMYDNKGLIEQLPFELANLTIIKTKKYRVIDVIPVNLDQIEKLINNELFISLRKQS
jgi:hypothetical protein